MRKFRYNISWFFPVYGLYRKGVRMKNSHNYTQKHKTQSKNLAVPIIFSLLIPVILCTGCSAPRFRAYKGPLRKSTEIAVIKTPDQALSVIRVDDEYLRFSKLQSLIYHTKWAEIVEVEPGEHKLLLMHDGLLTKKDFWISFNAEAGHIYEIRTYQEKLETVYRIIDITEKRTVLTLQESTT